MDTPQGIQESVLVYPKDLEDICVFWELGGHEQDVIKRALQRFDNDIELREKVKEYQNCAENLDDLTNPLSYILLYLGHEVSQTQKFIELLKQGMNVKVIVETLNIGMKFPNQ